MYYSVKNKEIFQIIYLNNNKKKKQSYYKKTKKKTFKIFYKRERQDRVTAHDISY